MKKNEKSICPFVQKEIMKLARLQHLDDTDVKKAHATPDYFDHQPGADEVFEENLFDNWKRATQWWKESNLSLWYDIE